MAIHYTVYSISLLASFELAYSYSRYIRLHPQQTDIVRSGLYMYSSIQYSLRWGHEVGGEKVGGGVYREIICFPQTIPMWRVRIQILYGRNGFPRILSESKFFGRNVPVFLGTKSFGRNILSSDPEPDPNPLTGITVFSSDPESVPNPLAGSFFLGS